MSWILPDERLDRLAMFYDVYLNEAGVTTAILYLASILGKGGRRNL
jgi:hypothetical protein